MGATTRASVVVLLAQLARPALAAPASPAAGRSWLDAGSAVGWNKAGGSVPRAPVPRGEAAASERCRALARPPTLLADRAVAEAGWTLFGPGQVFGGVEVVQGASGVDGMCRPMGYQGFAFVDGRFAGTIAPSPMDARTDGSARQVRLLSPETVVAEFARPVASDPLCCPSRIATVTYRLERTQDGPLLAVGEVRTSEEPRAMATAPGGKEPVVLGRTWELVRIQMMDGTALVPEDPSGYTLHLGADGRAAMRADCNRASASYQVAGKTLTFGPFASTRAFCPPPSISDRYLQQLGFAASFVVRDGRLHVATRADGAILEFR